MDTEHLQLARKTQLKHLLYVLVREYYQVLAAQHKGIPALENIRVVFALTLTSYEQQTRESEGYKEFMIDIWEQITADARYSDLLRIHEEFNALSEKKLFVGLRVEFPEIVFSDEDRRQLPELFDPPSLRP